MMGAWSRNSRPASPRMPGTRCEDPDLRGGIVPAEGGDGGRLARELPKALVLCAIGGALSATSTAVLAPALVAYGVALSALAGGYRGMAPGAALAVAAAAAVSIPMGATSLAGAVITALAGVVVAGAFWAGRLTTGGSILAVAAIFACHIGADAVLSALSGTTLSATMASIIDAYRQAFLDASPAASAQVDFAAQLLGLFWPVIYVAVGCAEGLSAHLGLRLLRAPLAERGRSLPSLSDYDVPLWVVALLVVTAGALAVALTVPAAPQALLTVSANVAMTLRFAFAVQGLAVLACLAGRRGWGTLPKVLLGALALYLEVQFIVLTVVGVVDVWANFRHLARGGADADDPTEQDKEPAQAG